MSEENYIKNRIDEQQTWFSKKASLNKKAFLLLSLLSAVGSLVASFIYKFSPETGAIISLLVAISISINTIYKFQRKWIIYRTTSEFLKTEKIKYQEAVGDYDISDYDQRYKLFVSKVERVIEQVNNAWIITIKQETNNKQF